MSDRPNRPFDPGVLREIVEGIAGETGEDFFNQLVRHLAQAIGTKCAWVTEWIELERRLRALAFWIGDHFQLDYEYDVVGTPCEGVVMDRCLVHIPERVVELYPKDPDLAPVSAVSYLGVPLFDTNGRLLGHLAVMHDHAMPTTDGVIDVFNVFASRAAAELRRLRLDRDLRDREQKLTRLFDSAMDAILELDGESRVTRVNTATTRIFGRTADKSMGVSVDQFLTRESCGKLEFLIQELDRRPAERQSLWIPDGLEGICAAGPDFPAEATLSRFEVGGRPFYSLILRNINERIDADRRIRALVHEADSLRAEIEALHGFDEIIGQSPALRLVLEDVQRVAGESTTVLITGPTGTGKELIARAIHRRSPRAEKPLVIVNCAAIAAGLQESELFGHERGAFTGATQRRDGRFKLADGGTIFLDEVGEMPLDLQAKLLRVLQEGEIQPVGSSRTLKVDVRVIAATNRDLAAMALAGAFRTDLWYRLNVFPIHLPPLRERGDDVVLLAESFAKKLAASHGRTLSPLTPECRARLKRYDWPGNVRELHNVIERAWITSTDGQRLNLDRALPEGAMRPAAEPAGQTVSAASPWTASERKAGGTASAGAGPESEAGAQHPTQAQLAGGGILSASQIQELERANTLRALEASSWKVSGAGGAAERLGVNPNTLMSRMKALGLRRPQAG